MNIISIDQRYDVPVIEQGAIEEIEQLRHDLDSIRDPSTTKSQRKLESALSCGVKILQRLFQTNRSHLNRRDFEIATHLEFEIYLKTKQVRNKLFKKSHAALALAKFKKLVKKNHSLKEIASLKKVLKNWNEEESAQMLRNKFSERLLGLTVKQMKDVFDKTEGWAQLWICIRRRIFSAAEELRPIQLNDELRSKTLTWVTGSSTASLVSIFRNIITDGPALIPTGLLLEHNIPPFTGELGNGLNGINRESLSGVDLAHHAFALEYARKAASSFTYSSTKEIACMNRIIERSREEISERGQISSLLSSLRRLKIAAIRLAWAGIERELLEECVQKLQVLKDHLETAVIEPNTLQQQLQEIQDLLILTPMFPVSNEESRFLEDPAPIIWGSFSRKLSEMSAVRSDIPGERGLIGPQLLGRDIQLLFIDPENIDSVREYSRQHFLKDEQNFYIVGSHALDFFHAHKLEHNAYLSFDPVEIKLRRKNLN